MSRAALSQSLKTRNLRAVDFFCGAGGMTYGLRQAGIEVIAGVDIDPECKETYEVNNPGAKFIKRNIKYLTPKILIEKIEISRDDDNLVFIGCSPCQYWSIIKTDKTKAKESKNLLKDFQRFVRYFNPGFVVIENVPGIVRSESPLQKFIDFLIKKGYLITKKIINVSDYGVPQSRRRFLLLASRVSKVSFPEAITDKTKLTVKHFIGDKTIFPAISAGHSDNTDFRHTAAGMGEVNLKRMQLTAKDGGTRTGWQDTDLQIAVYKKNDGDKAFGFRDTYGRMYWDRPASTITTKFFNISCGRFGHPEEDRAISLREGAAIQTFPNDYVFKTKSITSTARLIGNAVPPKLAEVSIGMPLINSVG